MIARLVLACAFAAGCFALSRAWERTPDERAGEPRIARLVPEAHSAQWRVAALSLTRDGGELVFAHRGGVWRCESAFGALALTSEVESVVRDLAEALGVQRSVDPRRSPAYGFDVPGMLRVALHGPSVGGAPDRDLLFALDLGASLPGVGARRSFVRPSGAHAVYEIQREPRALLESEDGLPPLLDRRVLAGEWPGSGEGVARAFVDFEGAGSIEIVRRALPGRAGEEWIAIEGGAESVCLPYRVAAWQAFLFRVEYAGFADPRDAAELGVGTKARVRLSLFLTSGDPIELTIGRPDPNRREFVANSKTGMLCLVAPGRAPLFAPTVDMLCETTIANPWEEWLRR